MPDFSMCQDDHCPMRAFCKRHEASGTRPNEWRQSYADFQRLPLTSSCEYIWRVPAPMRVQENK